jgi:hypothetical protein
VFITRLSEAKNVPLPQYSGNNIKQLKLSPDLRAMPTFCSVND